MHDHDYAAVSCFATCIILQFPLNDARVLSNLKGQTAVLEFRNLDLYVKFGKKSLFQGLYFLLIDLMESRNAGMRHTYNAVTRHTYNADML